MTEHERYLAEAHPDELRPLVASILIGYALAALSGACGGALITALIMAGLS